ncbi:MAG TPA: tRNA (N(6)-L-threonylcarbamoyladenosine(37)-C(2))-methylthiotransferase MtaB [Actinomycetota bacterium]|nr:tRNA (N(6)-L-threonylcarbamoyladenosine(37)-C(2))-methylthiotransferase MtaB [Actinomycetota bacterium]
MPQVAFATLGCRLNQAESDQMAESLERYGFVSGPNESADLVVVNTCTVTREATKASRSAIRRAVRANPDAKVVVIGCYAVSNPDEVDAIAGVDAVLDNDDKEAFVEALATKSRSKGLLRLGFGPPAARTAAPARVRANLKLQTGCDEWCSFCIIPITRGPLRSMDADAVVSEARARVAAGARELVLTGVHLGKYGYDLGSDERMLVALLERLLAIPNVLRIRLSSILSRHLTAELLSLMAADTRLCRYLHVPLQSGDDSVLEAMNRPYRIDDYVDSVRRARRALPDLALATDLIVGFPAETDAAFANTMRVVRELSFSKLHVFRYSPRPDTAAAELADSVSPEVKKARSKALIEAGNRIRRQWLEQHLERPLQVLVEDERETGDAVVCSGQTDDYVRVWFEGKKLLGSIVEVRGEQVRADGIRGRIA